MLTKIVGILLLVLGVVWGVGVMGAVVVNALVLAWLLVKLVLMAGMAYLGYRLLVGPRSFSA